VLHGLVRDPNGDLVSFDEPRAGTTKGNGSGGEMITDTGTIPGVSTDNNGLNHAWIRRPLDRGAQGVRVRINGCLPGGFGGERFDACNILDQVGRH
jgi:hypothetical protein